MMERKIRYSFAPSIRAASRKALGTVWKIFRMTSVQMGIPKDFLIEAFVKVGGGRSEARGTGPEGLQPRSAH